MICASALLGAFYTHWIADFGEIRARRRASELMFSDCRPHVEL